jgi:hypothetical protein
MDRGGNHVYDEIAMFYLCQLNERIVNLSFSFGYDNYFKKTNSINCSNIAH